MKRFNAVQLIDVDNTGAATTAEKLKRAIDLDTISQDPLTREHFGFSKVENVDGEVNLVGLYTGLFHYLNTSAAKVHQWQEQNVLAEGILEEYHPRESGYLAWFKKHLHVVDRDYVRSGGLKAPPAQGENLSDEFYSDRVLYTEKGRQWL